MKRYRFQSLSSESRPPWHRFPPAGSRPRSTGSPSPRAVTIGSSWLVVKTRLMGSCGGATPIASLATFQKPLAKGQKIHAHFDRVDFYGPQGDLRIVISKIRFVGEGELLRRRKESLERLKREGLCDKKRPLPSIPRCIGLIAGRDSEGQFDVLDAITKRWPPAKIKLVSSLVQGARAPEELVRSLLTLEADPEVDVIVLSRGGGSVQDLLAFDDEELCRIIANTETPVVAAIGHSRNRPNAYYVADAEAPVPRAAAELLVPAEADHRHLFDQANRILSRELEQARSRTSLIENLHKRLERFFGVEAQRSRLQKLDIQLQARGVEQLHSSAVVLASSRRSIESAWQRIPRKDSLDAPRAQLLAAGERITQNERQRLTNAEQSIPVALGKIPAPSTLDPRVARLNRAARRSHEEQRGEVERFARSLHTDLGQAKRNVATACQQVGSTGDRLSGTARRILDRAQEDLHGKAPLLIGSARKCFQAFEDAVAIHLRQIAALDPSARGFALLRTQQGAIVDSAADLYAGQAVRLELHDGSAEGHIDQVVNSKKEQK